MDEFLIHIYIEVFRKYVEQKFQEIEGFEIIKNNEEIIEMIKNKYKVYVTFNPNEIIELCVMNEDKDFAEFYLHFRMNTLKHALELFDEMLDCVNHFKEEPVIKILLCCSGGLTTTFFACKIEEAAQILNYHVEIKAVGYNMLYQEGKHYDVILLAPQVSYLHAQVTKIFKDKVIIKIPPKVFAQYDVQELFSLIQLSLNKEQDKKETKPLLSQRILHNDKTILCLSIYENYQRNFITYRVYHSQKILLDNQVVKQSLSIHDIFDVIDTLSIQYPDLKTVNLSFSSLINDYEKISLLNITKDHFIKQLQARYSLEFIISNDVNNAAIGYYAHQNDYSSIAFIFQPIDGFAGMGLIIDGKLIQGYQNFTGELKYVPFPLSQDYRELSKTPEGVLEILTQLCVMINTVIAPEMIVINNDLLIETHLLRKEINQYIPKKYIPQITQVNNLKEYILLGQMITCLV